MAATKNYMSWTGCGFTPLSGSLLPIDRVTSCKPNFTGTVEKFKGDIDKFNRQVAVPTQERMVTVDTGDVAAALAIPRNTPGTFVITLADPLNLITAGGGALLFTITPCICTDIQINGDHAKYAGATLTFEAYSPTDGVTDPATVTAV